MFILLKTLRDGEKNVSLAFMGIIKNKHFAINTNRPSLSRQNQPFYLLKNIVIMIRAQMNSLYLYAQKVAWGQVL